VPRVFSTLDEVRAAVGEPIGPSEPYLVDQARISAFAEVTDDEQWIHIDPERAAAGPYGTTIAHGYLTLSLVPMLVSEIYRVDGVKMGVNYGSNKLRFPAPVPVGSKVRAGVELVSVTPGAALATFGASWRPTRPATLRLLLTDPPALRLGCARSECCL